MYVGSSSSSPLLPRMPRPQPMRRQADRFHPGAPAELSQGPRDSNASMSNKVLRCLRSDKAPRTMMATTNRAIPAWRPMFRASHSAPPPAAAAASAAAWQQMYRKPPGYLDRISTFDVKPNGVGNQCFNLAIRFCGNRGIHQYRNSQATDISRSSYPFGNGAVDRVCLCRSGLLVVRLGVGCSAFTNDLRRISKNRAVGAVIR